MGKGRGEGKKEIKMGIGEMQIRIDPYDGAMKIGVELGRTKEPRSFSYGIIKEIGKERKDIYEKEIKENEEEITISDIEGNEERYKIEAGDEEKEYPYQCKKVGKRLKKEEEKYEIKDSQGNRYQYGRNGRLLQYEGKNSETLQYQSESEGYRYENEKYQIRCQENSEGNLIRVEVKEGERELERYELQYLRKEIYQYKKYIGEEKIGEIVIQQAYDREKGAMRYHIADPIHHQWIRCYRREEKIIEIDEGNQEEGSRGNPIHIHYEGQQRRIKDEEGNEILQGYDEEGRIVYAIDQKGRSERYQYDAENRLIEQSGVMEGIGTKIKEENEIKNSDFREGLAQYQTGGYAQVRVGKREHFLQQEEETWIQLASYGTSSYIEQRIAKKGKKKEEYSLVVYGKMEEEGKGSDQGVILRMWYQDENGKVVGYEQRRYPKRNETKEEVYTLSLRSAGAFQQIIVRVEVEQHAKIWLKHMNVYQKSSAMRREYGNQGVLIYEKRGKKEWISSYDQKRHIVGLLDHKSEGYTDEYDKRNRIIERKDLYGNRIKWSYNDENECIKEERRSGEEIIERRKEGYEPDSEHYQEYAFDALGEYTGQLSIQ